MEDRRKWKTTSARREVPSYFRIRATANVVAEPKSGNHEAQSRIGGRNQSRAKGRGCTVERPLEPSGVVKGSATEAELPKLKRHQLQSFERAARAKLGQVHEDQIAAIFLVTGDSLVIVDEVAAAVEDEPVAIHLNGPRMMRGMAVNNIDSPLDQSMSEPDMVGRDLVSPV